MAWIFGSIRGVGQAGGGGLRAVLVGGSGRRRCDAQGASSWMTKRMPEQPERQQVSLDAGGPGQSILRDGSLDQGGLVVFGLLVWPRVRWMDRSPLGGFEIWQTVWRSFGSNAPVSRNGQWVRPVIGQAGNPVEASSGFNPWVCLDWLGQTVMAARLRVCGNFGEGPRSEAIAECDPSG
jgi:hypothetical protein